MKNNIQELQSIKNRLEPVWEKKLRTGQWMDEKRNESEKAEFVQKEAIPLKDRIMAILEENLKNETLNDHGILLFQEVVTKFRYIFFDLANNKWYDDQLILEKFNPRPAQFNI